MRARIKKLVRFTRAHLRELAVERRRLTVDAMLQQLSALTPADFDLPGPDLISAWPPQVYYKSIYHDAHLDVGIFLLPRGASIPLHDHPFMTVFSKVLYGNLRFRVYDWCKVPAGSPHCGAAQLASEMCVNAGSPVLEVLPVKCNLHSIYAETHSAFIDFSIPPYDDERTCSYFTGLSCAEYARACASHAAAAAAAAAAAPALVPVPLAMTSSMSASVGHIAPQSESLCARPMHTGSSSAESASDGDPGSPCTLETDCAVPRASELSLASFGPPSAAATGAADTRAVFGDHRDSSTCSSPMSVPHHHQQRHPGPAQSPLTSVSGPSSQRGSTADPSPSSYQHQHQQQHQQQQRPQQSLVSESSRPRSASGPVVSSAKPFLPAMCAAYPPGHVHLFQISSDFYVEAVPEDDAHAPVALAPPPHTATTDLSCLLACPYADGVTGDGLATAPGARSLYAHAVPHPS